MPDHLQSAIQQQLGREALRCILQGFEVLDLPSFSVVRFWVHGHECEYYLDTDPPLLLQVETDKEFTTFNQLLEEITDGAIPCPTI